MKDPQPIEIEEADVEQLIQKAEQGTLDGAEQKRLVSRCFGPWSGFSAPCLRPASACPG